MKERKIIILRTGAAVVALIVFWLFYHFGKPAQMPIDVPESKQQEEAHTAQEEEKPEASQDESSEEGNKAPKPLFSDKLGDDCYRGRVTEIANGKITMLVDEEETFSFTLSDDAEKDIEVLEIAVGSRVIVTFEEAQDKTLIAQKIDIVTSE